MISDLRNHPIRIVALLFAVLLLGFLAYMAVWLTNTLSSSDWCAKALQAEKISPGSTFVGLVACVDLLKIQLQSLADNSKIVIGSFAFGLVVLVVIVLAGAKGQMTLPGGISGNLSPAGEAADKVVNAAADKAAQIKDEEPPPHPVVP